MKLNLADPEASIVEMAPVQVVLQDKVMCVRIRARNALGGWVMEDMVFLRNVERKVTGARLADYAKRIVSEAKGEDMGLLNAQLDLISGARK